MHSKLLSTSNPLIIVNCKTGTPMLKPLISVQQPSHNAE